MSKVSRYDDLELLRGIAAIAVVAYHFLRAFLPPEKAPPLADTVGFAIERPFVLAAINGPFMVTIFFVLSSFALTIKLVEVREPLAVLTASAKRLPRLLPLTLIGTVCPALLFALGLMFNKEVAALTGSQWLAAAPPLAADADRHRFPGIAVCSWFDVQQRGRGTNGLTMAGGQWRSFG